MMNVELAFITSLNRRGGNEIANWTVCGVFLMCLGTVVNLIFVEIQAFRLENGKAVATGAHLLSSYSVDSFDANLFLFRVPIVENLGRWRGHQSGRWFFRCIRCRRRSTRFLHDGRNRNDGGRALVSRTHDIYI